MTKYPEIFRIDGKPHQLESILKDLIEMGYISLYPGRNLVEGEHIEINICNLEEYDKISLDEFKKLYLGVCSAGRLKRFYLPEDYSNVLKFAKAQLDHDFWKLNVLKKESWNEKEVSILCEKAIRDALSIDKNKLENFVQTWKKDNIK